MLVSGERRAVYGHVVVVVAVSASLSSSSSSSSLEGNGRRGMRTE